MSEELNNELNQEQVESQQQEVPEQHSETSEQQFEQKEGKRFTQDEVNEIIGKRMSEERSKSQRDMTEIQTRLEKFEQLFSNFGKQPEQAQHPQIDPNRPLTIAEYQSIVQQQHKHQQEEIANQKINQLMSEAKSKFSDFEQVKEQHKEIFDMLDKDEVIAHAAVAAGQPYELLYNISKICPDEFKKISNISHPMAKLREMFLLEAKLKNGAKVPSVSGAPSPLADEKGDGSDIDAYDVQAARRRLSQR